MSTARKVLLVDDDEDLRTSLKDQLVLHDEFDVAEANTASKGMEAAKIDSPRGVWTLSKAHNPVQDMYLRKVVGKENKSQGVAWKALADPARGCKA